MNLPSAVKKAGERADSLQKNLGKPKEGTTPINGTPVDTSPDSQKPDVKTPDNPQSNDKTVDYQQKYQSLKGKFDIENPRMHQEIRELQRTVSDLHTKNSELMEAANNPKQKESEVAGLDPKDFAEYGEEFESLVKTIQNLQTKNAELQGQVEKVSGDAQQQSQNDYAVYMDQVKNVVSTELNSNFDQLNNDPAFLNFLRQFPENGQESRHVMLQRAEAGKNLKATIDIFKEYLGNISQAKPNPDPQPQPNVQPPANNTGTDIKPPTLQSTQTWSRAEISAFYNDLNNGKFKGRDDEAKAYEQDIYLAQTQGRIVA